MEHPHNFLLRNIVEHKKNGLSSLGELHAKHFNDIVKLLEIFGKATASDVIDRIKNGESVQIGDKVVTAK